VLGIRAFAFDTVYLQKCIKQRHLSYSPWKLLNNFPCAGLTAGA
jgi:hypothetical protein